jgi:hypothetical protein
MSKKIQPTLQEKKLISKFLLSLNGKNYSVAHKYLSKILEAKLNKRAERIINNF